MKAFILVGGVGTRLRPLTCTRAKSNIPIANKPLIEYLINQLKSIGVTEIVLGVHYRSYQFKEKLGDGKTLGVNIIYSEEEEPLGTAGAIKLAESFLKDAPFFVLNSDIVSSLNFSKMLETWKMNNVTGLISLYEVENPYRFGSVELDNNMRIMKFIEKPSKTQLVSKLINAGIYIFNPDILNYIPKNKKCSLERLIFPILAKEKKLMGFPFYGFWTDTGKPEDYLNANNYVLDNLETIRGYKQSVFASKKVRLIEPVFIGKNVLISEDSIIGPHVSIGDNSIIGGNTKIEESILFDHVRIGNNNKITKAIIGERSRTRDNVEISGLSVIGDHTEIEMNVLIEKNTSICPWKIVKQNIGINQKIM